VALRSLKVLLVDDHPAFRSITVRLLASLGHVVVDTGDAKEADALFRAQLDFDVVILDLFLREADGAMVAQQLEAVRPGIPVLLMSGSDVDPEGASNQWLKGPNRRFLSKPFSPELLDAALDALVG
jgi:CheY-like chemotaxis protein